MRTPCVCARARCPREWPSSRPLVDARWASHPRSSSFLDGVENKTHFINEKTRPKKREECGKKTGQTEFAVDSREFLSLFWMSEWTANVVLSFLRIFRNLLPFLFSSFFFIVFEINNKQSYAIASKSPGNNWKMRANDLRFPSYLRSPPKKLVSWCNYLN